MYSISLSVIAIVFNNEDEKNQTWCLLSIQKLHLLPLEEYQTIRNRISVFYMILIEGKKIDKSN